ncbi:hypothetical protein E0500_005605 [Streptomyces sp. KM273126]|uniref:hypothetical protein n=1 Tax=Streptomyces sp. KM273126 TaxID=2545247 RepID=UPI00103B945C|nr:hypothetical protein [Streptomyces sp. KM273126]MBA2806932.1 hypothetical protein [Streptomyces sp. KM273126]
MTQITGTVEARAMETKSSSVEALALLPLPDLAQLSEYQISGKICVWDGATLGPDAVDLGQRRINGRTVFPRACRRCMRAHAAGSDAAHRTLCEQCVDDQAVGSDTVCDTGRALRRLVLESGR